MIELFYMKKIENIRTDYSLSCLPESSLDSSPIIQFKLWFNEVLGQVVEPTAMVLSTYHKKQGVSSRVVLLKEIKKDGFIFYTNYNSFKSQQIALNPNVSLLFFWPDFQRQIRITGLVKKISNKSSTNYFKKRPRQSHTFFRSSQLICCLAPSEFVEGRSNQREDFYWYLMSGFLSFLSGL